VRNYAGINSELISIIDYSSRRENYKGAQRAPHGPSLSLSLSPSRREFPRIFSFRNACESLARIIFTRRREESPPGEGAETRFPNLRARADPRSRNADGRTWRVPLSPFPPLLVLLLLVVATARYIFLFVGVQYFLPRIPGGIAFPSARRFRRVVGETVSSFQLCLPLPPSFPSFLPTAGYRHEPISRIPGRNGERRDRSGPPPPVGTRFFTGSSGNPAGRACR